MISRKLHNQSSSSSSSSSDHDRDHKMVDDSRIITRENQFEKGVSIEQVLSTDT